MNLVRSEVANTLNRTSTYDKCPTVPISDHPGACVQGWDGIADRLCEVMHNHRVLVVECYTGVHEQDICDALVARLKPARVIRACDAMKSEAQIDALVEPFNGGNDPIFGYLNGLTLDQFFETDKLGRLRREVEQADGPVLVIGTGARLICDDGLLVYADLARWEVQLRMRRDEIANLGTHNHSLKWSLQYKRAFFTDWRVCDRFKKPLLNQLDFLLDTNKPDSPKLLEGDAYRAGLKHAVTRPIRVVPFFDPAPWGGQWIKDAVDLDRDVENYGWGFDCVPEENSLLLEYDGIAVEVPSINLVFDQPVGLLGDKVHARFGAEFPIRFDFLDTIQGGHLSFQVHPLTEYIQEHFGLHYTQDESYYMLEAIEGATVYLGTKTGCDPEAMCQELEQAQQGGAPFDAEKHVNRWPAKKHDHFLIPAGTVHCSGEGGMVLEISATPYIFTFKLWDWGRLGLDGLPRPINLERGKANIAWDRDTEWTRENLINRVQPVSEGEGWREERTGLHDREFIETRRHWFTGTVQHHTDGGVNVLNLVEGDEVIIESPAGAFEPYVIHYAETFIVPADVGPYTIRPHGPSLGKECATLKAYVRT
jgi:mannose-6-phosphate isomerase class I